VVRKRPDDHHLEAAPFVDEGTQECDSVLGAPIVQQPARS
jgi:hypothetical protein